MLLRPGGLAYQVAEPQPAPSWGTVRSLRGRLSRPLQRYGPEAAKAFKPFSIRASIMASSTKAAEEHGILQSRSQAPDGSKL